MTHKQQSLRWSLKYQFLEDEIVQMIGSFIPKANSVTIRDFLREEVEQYLKDQGLTYPTKASDK